MPRNLCFVVLLIPTGAILIAGLAGPTSAEEAVSYFTVTKFDALDLETGDDFGESVDIDGDLAVSGAERDGDGEGAVYVFERHLGGIDNWGQVVKLKPADPGSGAGVGTSVAVFGDTVVAGDPDWGGQDTGAVYVWQRDFGGTDNWGQVVRHIGDWVDGSFGSSIALDGDTMAVGSPWAKSESGAIYVYERDHGGQDTWGQVVRIEGHWEDDDRFGEQVTLSGDTLVVGSPWDDKLGMNAGVAYVFQRDFGGPDAWGQVAMLDAGVDVAAGDIFGNSVSIDGDTLAISSYYENRGAIYIFQRDLGGPDNWGQEARLIGDEVFESFGHRIALTDDTLVVGAPSDNDLGEDSGSAFVFKPDPGDPGNWRQIAKITAVDAVPEQAFGGSVAISGKTLIVGVITINYPHDLFGSAYILQETIVDPLFVAAGLCPGEVNLTASGATPLGRIEMWGGDETGHGLVDSGSCVGTELGLASPRRLMFGQARDTGTKETIRSIRESGCGTFLQFVDLTSCATSNVVQGP